MKKEEIKLGMNVLYVPRHANSDSKHKDCEHGLVSSKSDGTVFVRYYKDGELQWTGKSTPLETLTMYHPDPMAMIDEMAHIDGVLSHRKGEMDDRDTEMLRNRRTYLHEYSQELTKRWKEEEKEYKKQKKRGSKLIINKI